MWVGRRVLIPSGQWLSEEGVEMRVGGRFPDNIIDMVLLQLIETAYEKFGPLELSNPVVAVVERLCKQSDFLTARQGFFQKPKWFWSEGRSLNDINPLARSLTNRFLLNLQDLSTFEELCRVGGFRLELVALAEPIGPETSTLIVRITNYEGKCCSVYHSYTPESFLVLPCSHVAVRYELYEEMAKLAGNTAIASSELNPKALECKQCLTPITEFVFQIASSHFYQVEESKVFQQKTQCSMCGVNDKPLKGTCPAHKLCKACSCVNFLSQNFQFCACCDSQLGNSQLRMYREFVLEDKNLLRALENVETWRKRDRMPYNFMDRELQRETTEDHRQQVGNPPFLVDLITPQEPNSYGAYKHRFSGQHRPQTVEEGKRADEPVAAGATDLTAVKPHNVVEMLFASPLARPQSAKLQPVTTRRCRVCSLKLLPTKKSCQNECLCRYCVLVRIVLRYETNCTECNQPILKLETLRNEHAACVACHFITKPAELLLCQRGCKICKFCVTKMKNTWICSCKSQVNIDSAVIQEIETLKKRKYACCSGDKPDIQWLNTSCLHKICNVHSHYIKRCRVCRSEIVILSKKW